jgi:hypothetical protein
MGTYFTIGPAGQLCHEFTGTIEQLKEKFESDKKTQLKSFSEQISAQEKRITELLRPADYESKNEFEKKSIDTDIAAKTAMVENNINRITTMYKFTAGLEFDKQEFFNLESLKV